MIPGLFLKSFGQKKEARPTAYAKASAVRPSYTLGRSSPLFIDHCTQKNSSQPVRLAPTYAKAPVGRSVAQGEVGPNSQLELAWKFAHHKPKPKRLRHLTGQLVVGRQRKTDNGMVFN